MLVSNIEEQHNDITPNGFIYFLELMKHVGLVLMFIFRRCAYGIICKQSNCGSNE